MNQPNEQPKPKKIKVALLDFDPENPRFPPEVASGPTEELIERFIRDERLLEIIVSIADQGYFEGEPLLVVPHNNRFHVIEGNRRLAALKLLLNLEPVPEGRFSIEDACNSASHRPKEVPCLVFSNSNHILRYLGFRHITGIKSWGSLQKARYLKRIRDNFYSKHLNKNELTKLAREIGSRPDYVAQMLVALNLYERAEENKFYEVKGLVPSEIDFSILTTALSYSSISNYLGLKNRLDMDTNDISDTKLKKLLSWMFVAKENQKSILGESRNLKKLAAIVESPEAVLFLERDGNLEKAHMLSKGPAIALNQALRAILKRLDDAWSWLPEIDKPYPKDEDQAESIRKLSSLIRDAIRSKREEATDD